MTQKSSLGYFSREDLADLFHLGDPRVAQTQKDLHALHAHERVTDEYTDRHIQYLHEIGGVHGISDHDLLFSKTQAVESSAVAKQQAKEYALSHTSAYTLVSSVLTRNICGARPSTGLRGTSRIKTRTTRATKKALVTS